MTSAYLFFTLGKIPLAASRIFGTLFWFGLFGRLQREGVLPSAGDVGWLRFRVALEFPDWYVHSATLTALFILYLAEGASDKHPILSDLQRSFNSETKALGNFAFENLLGIGLGLGLAASAAAATIVHAGLGGPFLLALATSGLVWGVSKIRNSLLTTLTEFDEEDEIGLRRLLSWFEEVWVAFGALLLVLLPLLALTLSGLTVLALWALQRLLMRLEQRAKISCPHCSEDNYPSAVACVSCRTELPAPMRVGAFGRPTRQPVTELEAHRLDLVSKRRCFNCATRLPKKALRQRCPACGTLALPSAACARRYLRHVRSKLPRTVAISFALGLIPLVGLIPGVVYYRLSLIANFKRYVPHSTGCATRWITRLCTVLLLAFQWVPGLGALMLPALCLINYGIYRKVLERETERWFEAPEGDVAEA